MNNYTMRVVRACVCLFEHTSVGACVRVRALCLCEYLPIMLSRHANVRIAIVVRSNGHNNYDTDDNASCKGLSVQPKPNIVNTLYVHMHAVIVIDDCHARTCTCKYTHIDIGIHPHTFIRVRSRIAHNYRPLLCAFVLCFHCKRSADALILCIEG